ncbi:hypothetical protein AB0E85_26945 [Streptomyces sp. NPDC029044]|uniref:DUF2628 domain-containing protein n=1 Tax=Streptomyces sp. NPDC029044 TaxID=3157198 RepID=UPI0034114410
MAQSDRARRWARWLAAHRWWQHGLRWLLMAVFTAIVVTIAHFAGLPQWTLMIGIFLMLAMDDAVACYVKRWSAEPGRPGGEEVSA